MSKRFPKHIAIIPDGNRRWARLHNLPAHRGIETGAKRFSETAKFFHRQGVNYLTLWSASEDNLKKRNFVEVRHLVRVMKKELRENLDDGTYLQEAARIQFMGRGLDMVGDRELRELVKKVEDQTKHFSKAHLTILFGYDGKREMLEAIKSLNNVKSNRGEVTDSMLKAHLWTRELPPVDLVIRTGGEPHWSSGFMMWLTSDSQFHFTKKLWPDFNKRECEKALLNYAQRERRLGK